MKRAEIVDASAPLRVVSSSLPKTPETGARLKTTYGGICHSDLHILKDENEIMPGLMIRNRDVFKKRGGAFEGVVLGHEIAGVIEEFGSEATPEDYGLKVGDHVILYPWVGCGNCETCADGSTNDCDENPGMFYNYGTGPVRPGGYASHIAAHSLEFLIKVPENIPKHIVCMLPCSVLTAFTALKKTKRFINEGYVRNKASKLLIAGAGGLGLWCIQIAKKMYAAENIEITVADITEEKLEIAKSQGADFTVQWKTSFDNLETYMAEIQKTTKGGKYKFDAAIDFVGASNTFSMAYRSIRRSGCLISVGLFGGKIDSTLAELAARQFHIEGNLVGKLSDLKECVTFIANHEIQYPPVEFVALEDINDTLDRLRKGEVKGRALIKYTSD